MLALDEIAGHPLKPAVFTAYLDNNMFSRIADSADIQDIQSDPETQNARFRFSWAEWVPEIAVIPNDCAVCRLIGATSLPSSAELEESDL